jgi:hypothetical protein
VEQALFLFDDATLFALGPILPGEYLIRQLPTGGLGKALAETLSQEDPL